MKYRRVLNLGVFICLMAAASPAHGFDSLGFSRPDYPPYPNVLSQPLDMLPLGFITINVGDETFFYCHGFFYQKIVRDQKYVIVPPPVGAVVFDIPAGYQMMLMDGKIYYEYKGVFYIRVLEGYEVIYPPV